VLDGGHDPPTDGEEDLLLNFGMAETRDWKFCVRIGSRGP